jgi:hypothetical protein
LARIELNNEIVIPDSATRKTVSFFRARSAAKAGPGPNEDATLEFASESKAADKPTLSPVVIKVQKPAMLVVAATVGVLVIAGAVAAALALRTPDETTGSLQVESDPPGADVLIDGKVRGTTPLSLALPPGSHTLVVQRGADVKRMNVDVASGSAKAYHVAWAEPAMTTAPATGSLSVVSDPPGSIVVVDGSPRGQTPLTVGELAAGRHEVLVRNAAATYRRTVDVESGATVSLVVGGAPAAAPSWGWINVSAPFTVQVREFGRLIGTSEIERVMLSPGNHQLEFVNESLGFHQSAEVNVLSGRGEPISLTIPRVAININALPWAEVYVDGTRIGDTPLANVMQPIGDHEIVFRHPQLGEKRQVTRLTARESLRVSVDMRSR